GMPFRCRSLAAPACLQAAGSPGNAAGPSRSRARARCDPEWAHGWFEPGRLVVSLWPCARRSRPPPHVTQFRQSAAVTSTDASNGPDLEKSYVAFNLPIGYESQLALASWPHKHLRHIRPFMWRTT